MPTLASQYLPNLSEVHVQNETEEIIDDPSIIFYDPYEKPGFVYTAIPFISKGYDFSFEGPTESLANLATENAIREDNAYTVADDGDSSELYADSLDANSFPVTPLLVEKDSHIFDQQFDVSSRRDSLEFDNILEGNHPIEDFIAGIENESLHQTSYQDNSLVDYQGIHLYEENLLTGLNLQTNKGYISDAESVKTYQDSGIYDDDIDSPKSLSTDSYHKVARQLVFGTCDRNASEEKYTVFKTPMSSKQSSIESLQAYDEKDEITEKSTKNDIKKKQDTSFEQDCKPTRLPPSNKYSYVQAKVQCHRPKGERSPSPGTNLRSQSAGSNVRKPLHNNKTNDTSRRCHRKSPTDKMSNTKVNTSKKNKSNKDIYQRNKVFNEKLTFRERAKSRTDTHGVEMYSNLPKEFQEIARRLARQDRGLKKNEPESRGRSLSRRSSRISSRASSLSPTYMKPKRCADLSTEYFSAAKDAEIPSKALSRSSSIRSIPSTPAIGRQHPLPSLQHAKSPSVSPGRSPAHRSSTAESHSGKKFKKSPKEKSPMTSSVNKLYTFTNLNGSFTNSPGSANNSMFHIVPVR